MSNVNKFPSIEQFRHLARNVRFKAEFTGRYNESGEPIMDRNAKMPKLKFLGTEKIHGCVEKNTLISTKEHGEIPIKEIVDNKLAVHVAALDIADNKLVWAAVSEYHFLPQSGEWFEIETENGKKIIITGNNPVWLPMLECYRCADELKVGDELLLLE